ncbi:MAG: hypothetical protein AB3A66_29905 (plasmid) [Nodularia sp. CChRGM 3473]
MKIEFTQSSGKKMLRYGFQIVLAASTLFLIGSNEWKQYQAIAKESCVQPIGRIYSLGDSYLPVGKQICPGARIKPINGRSVKALCYLNGKFLHIKQSTVFDALDTCAPPSTAIVCTGRNPSRCNNAKSPDELQNSPTLISPYGSSMLSTRPQISWTAVQLATSYTVIVDGYEFYWEKTVDNNITTLLYPEEQKELSFNNTYKFTVIANKGDEPISSSETLVVSVLSEEEQNAIAQQVKQINELGLPLEEAAIWDLDAVYMSKNLLNETIETLKVLVSRGSQNPTLYRLLADRYLEAWLPNEALREYKKAEQLALSSGNSDELAHVQEGIKIIEFHNHPPTSTKPAQK